MGCGSRFHRCAEGQGVRLLGKSRWPSFVPSASARLSLGNSGSMLNGFRRAFASSWGRASPRAGPSRIISPHPSLRFGLTACCSSTVVRPSAPWPLRWMMARRGTPLSSSLGKHGHADDVCSGGKYGVFLKHYTKKDLKAPAKRWATGPMPPRTCFRRRTSIPRARVQCRIRIGAFAMDTRPGLPGEQGSSPLGYDLLPRVLEQPHPPPGTERLCFVRRPSIRFAQCASGVLASIILSRSPSAHMRRCFQWDSLRSPGLRPFHVQRAPRANCQAVISTRARDRVFMAWTHTSMSSHAKHFGEYWEYELFRDIKNDIVMCVCVSVKRFCVRALVIWSCVRWTCMRVARRGTLVMHSWGQLCRARALQRSTFFETCLRVRCLWPPHLQPMLQATQRRRQHVFREAGSDAG